MSFYEMLVSWHEANAATPKALLAGMLVSIVCSVIGCFIVLRRTAFLADAVAHSMLAGVVCGYLLMTALFPAGHHGQNLAFADFLHSTAMIIGALLAGVLTVAMVGFVSKFTRVKEDAAIGIMYTGIFAAGGVLHSKFSNLVHIDLVHFLTGQLLSVHNRDLITMAIVTAGVLALVILLFRPLQLVSFDPVMAASIGIPVLLLQYVLTVCTSLVVVTGVTVVGVILVVGLLIIPASTAYLLCDRLTRMLPLAAVFGVTGFLLGYAFAVVVNVAPGASVVLACAVQFGVVFCVAPKYGFFADWMRRYGSPRQQVIEHVLLQLLRTDGESCTTRQLVERVEDPPKETRHAIRTLIGRELIESRDDLLELTSEGKRQAQRLLRAHRLWETYLKHVGEPDDALHPRAHHLEHVHDDETVEYLDDKLGHPVLDPHGSEIPADVSLLSAGAVVKLSAMRDGSSGEVTGAGGLTPGIKPGDDIQVGPRRDEDRLWEVTVNGDQTLLLDHAAADSVEVRVGNTGV